MNCLNIEIHNAKHLISLIMKILFLSILMMTTITLMKTKLMIFYNWKVPSVSVSQNSYDFGSDWNDDDHLVI